MNSKKAKSIKRIIREDYPNNPWEDFKQQKQRELEPHSRKKIYRNAKRNYRDYRKEKI